MLECKCGDTFESNKAVGYHKRTCTVWKAYVTNTLTIDFLLEEYVNNKKSMPDISNLTGIGISKINKMLKAFDIKTRSLSESSLTDRAKIKFEKTCMDRYGVRNPSQSPIIKEKVKEAFVANYGVDNIFKTDGFGEYVTKLCLERYGVKRISNPDAISAARAQFTEEKWKCIHTKFTKTCQERYGMDNPSGMVSWTSSIELAIIEALHELGIEFTSHKKLGRFIYDIYIPKFKLFIEVNGDFWHANPSKYVASDILNHPGGNKLASEIWKKDERKKKYALDCGYSVVYLWETDINKSTSLSEYIENSIETYVI